MEHLCGDGVPKAMRAEERETDALACAHYQRRHSRTTQEREAEAEAKATAMVSAAISQGNVQAINYFVAQKYVDVLGKIASTPNQKIMFLPLEAASVIGALGGIAEIARQTFGGDKSGDAGASAPSRRE